MNTCGVADEWVNLHFGLYPNLLDSQGLTSDNISQSPLGLLLWAQHQYHNLSLLQSLILKFFAKNITSTWDYPLTCSPLTRGNFFLSSNASSNVAPSLPGLNTPTLCSAVLFFSPFPLLFEEPVSTWSYSFVFLPLEYKLQEDRNWVCLYYPTGGNWHTRQVLCLRKRQRTEVMGGTKELDLPLLFWTLLLYWAAQEKMIPRRHRVLSVPP